MWLYAELCQYVLDITDQKAKGELTDRSGCREIVVKAYCRGRLQTRQISWAARLG